MAMLGITLLASGIIGIAIESYLVVQTPRGGQPPHSPEMLSVTNADLSTPGQIALTLANTGSIHITVATIQINNKPATAPTPVYVYSNCSTEIVVSYDWRHGYAYQIKLVTERGNTCLYTCVAPAD